MLQKSGKPHHPVSKFVQTAFHGLEESMKIYGTLKGAFEVAKGVATAGQNFHRMAAPVAAALI